MAKVRVACFSVSIDGIGAGPAQDLNNPMGVGGMRLHDWVFPTHFFRAKMGQEGGATGIDNDFAVRGFHNVGAWILGRNMFGPVRGSWSGADDWKGWWGTNPPYHCPVYVLTHHPRPPLEMEGGTTFHFVTGGIHEALSRAREAARGKDVRIGGGVSTVRQYLSASLIDELHLVISPLLMGAGENLFHGLDLPALGYRDATYTPSPTVSHVVITRA